MAHYATSADIIVAYGEAFLVRISDKNKDRLADLEIVEAGLEAADDIINAYLSSLYPVPLIYVSKSLRKLAVDIGVYSMAIDQAVRTEEMRLRYEDARAMLKLMAEGKIGLGLPPTDADGDGILESDPNRKRKGRIFEIDRG